MARFPGFPGLPLDLSRLDLGALRGIDPLRLAGIDVERVVTAGRDATYAAVGAGVLAFQQLQVRRREIATTVAAQVEAGRGQLESLLAAVGEQIRNLGCAAAPRAS